MKIGLIDADLMDNGTRHPNLVITKLAGYYRDKGDDVQLIFDTYDSVYNYEKVFISCVFNFTKVPEWVLQLDFVEYGGTGFFPDGGKNLPDEIEHHMPYYDIYKPFIDQQIKKGKSRTYYQDYLDFSIGFTTRGCFRKCSFCVNKKYDHVFRHSPVKEFLDESRPYIYLWDDNILAYPQWEEVLDELEETGKPFQFRQGIDIRLMTDRKAYRFVNSRYRGDFIFAFDHLEDKSIIVDKLQLWKRYSSKISKLYVIAGYKSQDEKDIDDVFQRISVLMKLGSLPYIMRYELYEKSKYRSIYIELARWCNQPQFYKKKSFREFCIANQQYKKDQTTNCSAYQSMLDFEKEYPEIAKKYFDLKFENENIYKKQYGYGRKYANKPLCKDCKKNGVCWDNYVENICGKDDILKAYLTKEIDLECLRYENKECRCSVHEVSKKLVTDLVDTSEKRLLTLLRSSEKLETISEENIPQFSNISLAVLNVPNRLSDVGIPVNFEDLGYYISLDNPNIKQNKVAQKKYGENHAKLATLLDLAYINTGKSSHFVEISQFGKYVVTLSNEDRMKLAEKLRLRIPIIQRVLMSGEVKEQIDQDISILSPSTQKRRRSNVIDLVEWNIR